LQGAEKEKTGYKGRVKSVKVSSFDIEQIDGKLVRTRLFENISKYDEKGNIVEEVRYNSSEKINSKGTYKYDEIGNLVETLTYDASGKVTLKNSTKYDKKGNKIKKTSYDFFLPTEFLGNEETWEFTYWN